MCPGFPKGTIYPLNPLAGIMARRHMRKAHLHYKASFSDLSTLLPAGKFTGLIIEYADVKVYNYYEKTRNKL
jgi:hypothetical protein